MATTKSTGKTNVNANFTNWRKPYILQLYLMTGLMGAGCSDSLKRKKRQFSTDGLATYKTLCLRWMTCWLRSLRKTLAVPIFLTTLRCKSWKLLYRVNQKLSSPKPKNQTGNRYVYKVWRSLTARRTCESPFI